jgi:hypothetical protein
VPSGAAGTVEGSGKWLRRSWARVKPGEGDDRWSPSVSQARRGAKGGLRRGRFPVMEAKIRQGRHRLVGLLGRWRDEAARERVGRCGRSGPAGPKSKESFKTDLIFLILVDFEFRQDFGNLYKKI